MTKCWPNLLHKKIWYCFFVVLFCVFMNLAILPSKPSKVILFKASMSFILRNCTHQSLCPALAWKKPAPFINSFTEFQTLGNLFFLLWIVFHYAKTAVFIPHWVLNTEEKIETCFFDFDTALIAFGGTLGLYLGWSIHSIFVNFIDMTVKHQSKVSSWCK